VFAGRYATPVVVPPCVAIVAAGKRRHQVTPVMGGIRVARVIPLSLTFDHRACTGGEAARFLKATARRPGAAVLSDCVRGGRPCTRRPPAPCGNRRTAGQHSPAIAWQDAAVIPPQESP
jgi:hypothetical protein